MIRAHHLGFTFASGRIGIASIDLAVAAGELVALVGPNGSGKTTLLRVLAGDLEHTAGNLSVAVTHIGFATAQPIHFDELTGLENAEFFARANGAGDDAIRRLLASFHLLDDANVPVGEYSFGMQRKLSLVEALAPAPQLLLLDEPAIGLDPAGFTTLIDALHDHVRAGNTVIIATNDLSAAMQATRVVFLHRGRKVADAPPDELLRSVRGKTHIDVSLTTKQTLPPSFPSGVTAASSLDGFSFEVNDAAQLPDVCAALIRAGARIGAIRLREPNLGDVFEKLTGEALSDGILA